MDCNKSFAFIHLIAQLVVSDSVNGINLIWFLNFYRKERFIQRTSQYTAGSLRFILTNLGSDNKNACLESLDFSYHEDDLAFTI